MSTRNILIIILLLVSSITGAQTFKTLNYLCDTCNRDLSFRAEGTIFAKNNEYFSPYLESMTGIGFFLKPTLEYYLTPTTRASAGAFFEMYFGDYDNTQIFPIFSIQQRITKNLEMVFGSIYGTVNHGLDEPLFRFDRYYTHNVEYGVQFLWHSRTVVSDLWLNWEDFMHYNEYKQEELTIGSSTLATIYNKNRYRLDVPLQMLITHYGGQLNPKPEQGLLTTLNAMTGVSFDYQINKNNKLSVDPEFYLYYGKDIPAPEEANYLPWDFGYGLYLKTRYRYKFLESMLGYWFADRYIALRGEYLFSSVAEPPSGYSERYRHLLTGKFMFKTQISSAFRVEVRAEAYYDIPENHLDYSYSLFFVMNELFFIKKLKKTVPESQRNLIF